MNFNTTRATIYGISAAMLTAVGVASCGGGGGGASFGGIDRLGVSSGAITGFGSIFVNGVEWETDGATIMVDDNPGIESDLRVGQVVTIRGTLNSSGTAGQADEIEFDNSLEGSVSGISLAAGSFTVLGQTVITSADTEFDDSIPDRLADGARTLEDLADGDVVEVSGYRDAQGAVRATRVELRSGGVEEFELKGVVSGLNAGASRFQIGTLLVDYAGAGFEDFGTDTLSNGDYVEVEGILNGVVLEATKVEREDELPGDDGDSGEIEGFITRFASATDFDVNGVRVTTNSGTEFEGGTAADLAANVKVEVQGEVNAAGILVADKVEFRVQPDDTDAEIAGTVGSVNANAATLAIEGMNVVIRTTATTSLEDDLGDDGTRFTLGDLSPGDYVRIRGAEDLSTAQANDMIATRLERDEANDEVIVRGPVQAINEPDVSVLGVVITTDSALEFQDANDNVIDAATFFATIAVGDVVKAATTVDGINANTLIAREIEIEELD